MFDAIILAGGGATRLGADKPEELVGGRRLIDLVLDAVSGARRRIVVGPARRLPDGVATTREEPVGGGPAAAVVAGLALVEADWTVIAAADLPFLSARDVDGLLAAASAARGGAVMTGADGRDHWVVGAYPTAELRRSAATIEPEGAPLARLLDPVVAVRVPALSGHLPPPWWDCDTRSDLDQARRWAANPPRLAVRSTDGGELMGEGLSDEAVLAGVAINDPASVTVFVRRFQRRVFGLAHSIVGDSAAEDIAQQAFERAWRHAHMYDPRRGTVQAWLLTITRNLAIDQLRTRRGPTLERLENTFDIETRRRGPEDEAVVIDASARLRRAMADLPAEQKRCLVLAAFGGLTAAEISELDGIPLGTAKTRIRAAMIKLRAALADQDVGP
ncbi:MAG TPA: sigma-70 family RNA polymerase sigma factor [Acidimicrobiales bacterium]|nr:sigma-70 family RNA polymerase sigma factor [Acidimicrobiales bacterium]